MAGVDACWKCRKSNQTKGLDCAARGSYNIPVERGIGNDKQDVWRHMSEYSITIA